MLIRLTEISSDKREKFVDTLFSVFEMANIKTVDDLAKIKVKQIIEILKVIKELSKEDKKIVIEIIKTLVKEANKNRHNNLKR